MKTNKITKLALRLGVALGIILFSSATLAPPASAATAGDIDPGADTSLTITKLEQPLAYGAAADGLPLPAPELAGMTPIAGAQFAATRVPLDAPITTAGGWIEAATLSVTEATARTAGTEPAATKITDAAGQAVFDTLGVGLFLIEETAAPSEVVRGAPFLVALPIPLPGAAVEPGDPGAPGVANGWLYDVHVYPKNSRVSINLQVTDAAAYAIGVPGAAPTVADTVMWAAHAEVPRQQTIGAYSVTSRLDPQLQFIAEWQAGGAQAGGVQVGGVRVTLSGSAINLDPSDFTVTAPAAGTPGDAVTVTFTAQGLEKLVAAKLANDNVEVIAEFATQVIGQGELKVTSTLCPATECLVDSQTAATVSDSALTKWGPLGIEVHEQGNQANRIAGAKFKLFLTEADARAGSNHIEVAGFSEWSTDAMGNIVVEGLRLTNFANGLIRLPGDLLYRQIWVVLTQVPSGWLGSSEPIALEVLTTQQSQMQVAYVELQRPPVIPETGGTVTAYVIGATVLLTVGVFLLISAAKRRKDD